MEIQARVLIMTVEDKDGQPTRRYTQLKLEREQVLFMPLTWTVVHPIDGESPLFGLTAEDLERLQAEVMILIKAYDDTFSQTVLARYSYRYDEISWNRRFAPAFSVDAEGDLVLELQKVGEISDSGA
jgi:inward rectifier potassium channel